jgi:hypothetical protein
MSYSHPAATIRKSVMFMRLQDTNRTTAAASVAVLVGNGSVLVRRRLR